MENLFRKLPRDVIFQIFEFLDKRTMRVMKYVSLKFYHLHDIYQTKLEWKGLLAVMDDQRNVLIRFFKYYLHY